MAVFACISNKAKAFWQWLLAFCRWLREPGLFWLTALVLLIAIAIAVRLKSEPAFRLTGLVLQLLGTATVAWNIRGTRTLFGRPGTVLLVRQWWRRRPRFGSSVTSAVGGGAVGISAASARIDVWHFAESGDALEGRLDAVEKNLAWMRDRMRDVEKETRTKMDQQSAALEQETKVRADTDRDIQNKMRAAQLGGLHISATGITWLVAGAIMSTAATELACIVSHLP